MSPLAALMVALSFHWLPVAGVLASATPASQAARASLGEAREQGSGILRFLGMRVYEATLWVAARPVTAPIPIEGPFEREFVLELHYAISARGERIAELSAREIARIGQGSEAQRAAWLGQMKALFPDVASGDRLAGHYRPGEATRFFFNGMPMGEVADPAFGRAFFGIWLDRRSSEPELREALLRPRSDTAAGAASRGER